MINSLRYLMIKLGRYFVGPNWVQVKVDARVPVPEHLDLTAFRGLGKQEWEEGMLEEAASGAGGSAAAGEAAAASSAVEPNAAIVESLLSMVWKFISIFLFLRSFVCCMVYLLD